MVAGRGSDVEHGQRGLVLRVGEAQALLALCHISGPLDPSGVGVWTREKRGRCQIERCFVDLANLLGTPRTWKPYLASSDRSTWVVGRRSMGDPQGVRVFGLSGRNDSSVRVRGLVV